VQKQGALAHPVPATVPICTFIGAPRTALALPVSSLGLRSRAVSLVVLGLGLYL
jgi:hypothetical protein